MDDDGALTIVFKFFQKALSAVVECSLQTRGAPDASSSRFLGSLAKPCNKVFIVLLRVVFFKTIILKLSSNRVGLVLD